MMAVGPVPEKYKWKPPLEVEIKIRDGRGLMPDILANGSAFRIATFVLGGPPAPGVVTATPAARLLCDLWATSGQAHDEYPLFPVRALSILDRWQDDAASLLRAR